MRITRKKFATLVLGLAALGLLSRASTRAADHVDGPAASADPAADITDVFAWMSPDAAQMYLVMDVVKNASTTSRFSNTVQYVFHTTSKASFGATTTASFDIICEFDVSGQIRCWAGTAEFIGGDASGLAGIATQDGKFRVFAGLRDDPFYFNLTGFKETAKIVGTAAPSLAFDAAGCPQLNSATSQALVNQLKSQVGGTPAKDDFAKFNVLAIVIAIDKSLVTAAGPIVGVWGSTHRKV